MRPYLTTTRPKAQGALRSNGTREFGFRVSAGEAEEILAFARQENMTVSEAIRTLIAWGLESAGIEDAA